MKRKLLRLTRPHKIFNEPDFTEQSNIPAVQAAVLWKRYIEPMKADGIRLGGPAITNSGTGQPASCFISLILAA